MTKGSNAYLDVVLTYEAGWRDGACGKPQDVSYHLLGSKRKRRFYAKGYEHGRASRAAAAHSMYRHLRSVWEKSCNDSRK